MSFNINTFRGSVNRHGGVANENKFEVLVIPPASLLTNVITYDLRFFCDSVQIPGFNLDTVDIQRQGYGYKQKSVTNLTLDPVTTTFIVDANHRVTDFFRRWHRSIINYDNSSINEDNQGRHQFELNYRQEYTGVLGIVVYGKQDTKLPTYSYLMRGAYPSVVGPTQLSWGNTNSFLKQNITFEYSSMTHEGMNNHYGPFGQFRPIVDAVDVLSDIL